LCERYVNVDRLRSEELIRKLHDLKQFKAIFVTVDAAALGKREDHERLRAKLELVAGIDHGKAGTKATITNFVDPKLCKAPYPGTDFAHDIDALRFLAWKDIKWLRSQTDLPIGLKGIQCVEDVVQAVESGVDAVYLSNHGGRQLYVTSLETCTYLRIHWTGTARRLRCIP